MSRIAIPFGQILLGEYWPGVHTSTVDIMNDPAVIESRITAEAWATEDSEIDRIQRITDGRRLREDGDLALLIMLTNDNPEANIIGIITLSGTTDDSKTASLGISIGGKANRGKGYGTDAVRAVCQFGFQTFGLHMIKLEVKVSNSRAIRAYEKCGFKIDLVTEHIDHFLINHMSVTPDTLTLP